MRCSFCTRRKAFTLVELLVVIGIIAVLVGILLPALSKARSQAMAVKCAAALKEIGNSFQMYAIESKGWFPPAQLLPVSGKTYVVNGVSYPNASYGAFWFNFLAKYVTKNNVGLEATNGNQTADTRNGTVFWGCPAWSGYYTGSTAGGGYNRLQLGYGMNTTPTFTPGADPYKSTTDHNTNPEYTFVQNWPNDNIGDPSPAQTGRILRQKAYGRDGAQRCLVADSLFWEVEATKVTDPNNLPGQASISGNTAAGPIAFGAQQSLMDQYRHGKYPNLATVDQFQKSGGRVAFNILYCDGHVAGSGSREDAYRTIRMRFPG